MLALGVNGIVGVGIFFAPKLVAALVPGVRGVWAYAFTLLALIPVALSYARLGARFERDGGPCVWAEAALGQGSGFVVGIAAYASAVLSTAAVLAGLGEYSAPLLGPSTSPRLISITLALAFTLIVLSGVKPSAWTWSLLTVLKLLPLLALVSVFALHGGGPAAPPPPPRVPADAWTRAALVIMFAMQGFEIVPVPGSLVRSPQRAIPLATLGSLVLCAALYALLHWACASSVPELATNEAPLVAAGAALGGAPLAALLRAGTTVSALGIAFGMLAMTPRYLSALIRPAAVLVVPSAPVAGTSEPLAASSAALAVPSVALAVSTEPALRRAIFVTLGLVLLLISWGALSRLFVLSSVAVLFQYSVSALSLAVLALRRSHGLLPRDALPAPFALGALALIASAIQAAELWVMAGILCFALLLWFALVRPRR